MSLVGILLAAGRGRRFDPTGAANKLLQALPGGEPVVFASAHKLLAVLPRVIAVTGPHDFRVAELLRAAGCEVTVCAQADAGMGETLAHAVRHSFPQAGTWLVALGDMPHVQASTIAALASAIESGAAIAAPYSGGRRGNPVAFGAEHRDALLALAGDEGARAIVRSNEVTEVQVSDPGIFRDIDTPDDLLFPSDSG